MKSGRIVKFIQADNYSKLFAATYNNYPMRLQLRNAFCALYHSDKAEYEKQIANVCCAVKNKITVMFSGITNIFSELPETYHETYDYDQRMVCKRYKQEDKSRIQSKRYVWETTLYKTTVGIY